MATVTAVRSESAPCRANPAPGSKTPPYLEYLANADSTVHRIVLDRLPFSIGRTTAAHFLVPCGRVSRVHAEIVQVEDDLWVRDLGSTNGTYVNGHRVQDAPLVHGDILHLAHNEFRFLTQADQEEQEGQAPHETDPCLSIDQLPLSVLCRLPHLKEMIRHCQVRTFFQPILALDTRETVGSEALVRGLHSKLSGRPGDLFRLAERCRLAAELSRMCRGVAVAEVRGLPGRAALFVNLHPAELHDDALLGSLEQARSALPAKQALVLEIHEEAMTDLAWLRCLRQQLRDLDIGLAYDDFGAGQCRLRELAEVPPDFVKLDMKLVRDLHQSPARQGLVKAISGVARGLGTEVLAEGIETEDEADACWAMGCRLGQGYLLGRPQALPLPPAETGTWKVESLAGREMTR